jgi:hypothetical protein
MLRFRGYSSLSHFDTFRFVQRLESDGLQRDAAEAIMNSLGEVIGQRFSFT